MKTHDLHHAARRNENDKPRHIEIRRTIAAAILVLIAMAPASFAAKRRSVGRDVPAAACTLPTVRFTTSRATACAGESVTLSWTASDPRAAVTIVGVSGGLPSTGNMPLTVFGKRTLTAVASNTCGPGATASLTIEEEAQATGTLNVPAAVAQNSSANITFSLAGAVSWIVRSSLGNTFSITSGGGSGSFAAQYFAARSGTDTVTVELTNRCAEQTLLSRAITVTPAGGTTPPTGGGGLRCCDGTLSPTCFSCSSKQGCCSSHGGVCGCG